MRIAVGSTRPPKLDAVRRALAVAAVRQARFEAAELLAFEVPDAAPAMPLSIDALCRGARRRAERALELGLGQPAAELGIGLEGGLELRGEGSEARALLMSWAFVTDGRRGFYGCGGGLELPAALARRVLEEGQELSQAVDALTGRRDVRSQEGAWGVLTRGGLDRTRSFEIALVNALAPFYNPEAYA